MIEGQSFAGKIASVGDNVLRRATMVLAAAAFLVPSAKAEIMSSASLTISQTGPRDGTVAPIRIEPGSSPSASTRALLIVTPDVFARLRSIVMVAAQTGSPVAIGDDGGLGDTFDVVIQGDAPIHSSVIGSRSVRDIAATALVMFSNLRLKAPDWLMALSIY